MKPSSSVSRLGLNYLEIVGYAGFWLRSLVHSVRTVYGRDVVEPALRFTAQRVWQLSPHHGSS